jgi:hypothetical protein
MKGRIVRYFPADRCFVIHPSETVNNGCDLMVSEDDVTLGSVDGSLTIEFDPTPSEHGWIAKNVRRDTDE